VPDRAAEVSSNQRANTLQRNDLYRDICEDLDGTQ
jgi:hypothetical protein